MTKVRLIESVPSKTVKGKVEEISTGLVFLVNDMEAYLILETTKCVNWTEESVGRTVVIEYVTMDDINCIRKITFK